MAAGAATRRNVGRVSPTWWVLLGSLAVQVASKDSDDLVRGPVQPSPIRVPVLRRAYDGAPEHGRRLVGEISGNLETLGYYAANVCIGSPGSMHQLIIDTGSSMTAVPCATCTTCGRHKNPKYNPVRSLTSKRLGCKNPPFHMRCSRCENTQCGYAVSYTEGSQIRGAVFTDHVHFGDGLTAFTERMVVGCQTHETGLFKGQVADGMCVRACERTVRDQGLGCPGGGGGGGGGGHCSASPLRSSGAAGRSPLFAPHRRLTRTRRAGGSRAQHGDFRDAERRPCVAHADRPSCRAPPHPEHVLLLSRRPHGPARARRHRAARARSRGAMAADARPKVLFSRAQRHTARRAKLSCARA